MIFSYHWLFFLIQVIINSAQRTNQGPPCPKLLDCQFPKKKIEYIDPETKCMHRVCTCQGTKNGLSTSGASSGGYSQAKLRYTNCTLVDGNLELAEIKQNVTFTKHIQQVTGYVIITRVYAQFIDLSSLRLIRGLTLHENPPQPCKKSGVSNRNVTGYALFVIDNFKSTYGLKENGLKENGLKEIWMPNLAEISRGNVFFLNNKHLCFVNSVLWKSEIFLDPTKQSVEGLESSNFTSCPNCSSSCKDSNHCWGSSPRLCQLMTKTICPDCKQGCVNTSARIRCCDADCAGGCFHQYPSGCYACRKVSYNGKCKESCPSGKKPDSDGELVKDVDTVHFAGYCLKKCPPNIPLYDKFCQTFCPRGTFDFKNNVCDECENKNCNNICYGLGVKHGNLSNDTYINANNIKQFNKNCTIIEGSVHFKTASFVGDKLCKVNEFTSASELERFENVREITGYLAIEEWIFPDICIFKNLRRIQGKELFNGQYALSVLTDSGSLKSLCFNSLKTIDKGDVYIKSNQGLCYTNKVKWKSFFIHPKTQRAYVQRSKKNCAPCSPFCDSTYGCWGKSSEQCTRCSNFTDLTNSNGQIVPEWIVDSDGKTFPGNNVSTCVQVCNFTKGVYASSNGLCLPCDNECKNECTGPGPDKCKECRNKVLGSTCVPECSSKTHFVRNKTCIPCSPGCLNLSCSGPLDKYDTKDGCRLCHYSYDNSTKTEIYRGGNCDVCTENTPDCHDGCERTQNNEFSCIVLPRENVAAIVIPIVLVVLIPIVLVLVCLLKRNRSTINQMRKTIKDNMVGEHDIDDDEVMPLTPSGAEPNQARLRIVKDHELVMGIKLGSGAFGDVHKAIWNPMNIQGEKIKIAVAVKTLKVLENVDSEANDEIMDEAYVMASVDCDYLVRLLGIRLAKTVSLITQLMPLGSLLEYVRDVKQQEKIHSRQMLTWFVQIAKGMLYLQDKHLVHRDLAARNVLVRTPNHVKITDFGLAKMLDFKKDTYQAEGGKLPIKWLAIECITERLFSHHSDVWAYGITCWEILTFGARPYNGVRAIEILSLLERGERLLQPPAATIDVYMLLIKCWMVDRTCRPSFAELVAEFTRMAMDPSRYLVLQNDIRHCSSPNQIDEDKFFQLLMEEEKIDDALIANEPDQYLLQRNLSNEERPVYTNQEVVNRIQDSHSPHTGSERLFSRTTPSANLEPIAVPSPSASGITDATGRVPSTSEQDEVFADTQHSTKQMNGVNLRVEIQNDRKDSEETHRYTEDPTQKKFRNEPEPNHQTSISKFSCDEDDYLLPITGQSPAYFDPEGNFTSSQPSSLINDTYMESPPLQAPGPSRSRGPSDPSYTLLAACQEQDEHDYVNAHDKPSNTFFANEEYMATGADSGIGEDTQSLLSRGMRAKQEKRSEWEPSVSSDENEQVPIKDNSVLFKPESSKLSNNRPKRNPWSVSSDASSSSHNSANALNNPGYMMLNASSNSNKQTVDQHSDLKPV